MVERAEALEVPEVRYCHQALETSPNEESIGELAWVGDIMEMAKELVTLQDEVTRLENEQSFDISNVQKSRSDCAKLSTDTAALRLSMYTRRIVHRYSMCA